MVGGRVATGVGGFGGGGGLNDRLGKGEGGAVTAAGGVSGRLDAAGAASVALTLKLALQPRQRIVLPPKAVFIRNVRPHSGQLRASWPSITLGVAKGGSVTCAPTWTCSDSSGTFVVSFGTWKIPRHVRQRIFLPRAAVVR